MSKSFCLLIVMVTVTKLVCAQQTSYNFVPNSFPSYELTIRVMPDTSRIEVQGTILLPEAGAARDKLQLALSKSVHDFVVEVLEPTSSAGPAKIVKRDLSRRLYLWSIQPISPIEAGVQPKLKVSYSATNDPIMPTMFLGSEGSFAVSQSTGVPWYPTIDPSARAVGTLRFLVPPGYSAISTGRNLSRDTDAKVGNFKFQVTVPSALSFAVARYTVLKRKTSAGMVSVYLLQPRKDAQNFLDGARTIIDELQQVFGPYPFGEFALVEAPPDQFRKTLGVVAVSVENFLLISGALVPNKAIATGISLPFYAHEIAHQWWAVLLQLKSRDESLVLTEGMANYAALRVVEALEGNASAARYRRSGYPGYDEDTQSGRGYFRMVSAGIDRKLTELTLDDVSHQLATNKGFLFHDMLSRVMGQKHFDRFLREFVRAHAFQQVSLQDFRKAAELATKTRMQSFFEQWLERTGAPNFQLIWERGEGNTVRGVITQTPPYYYTMLEVELTGSGGRRLLHSVEVFGERTPFNWPLPIRVKSITLDPDYKVLRWTPEFKTQARAIP